MATMKKTEMDAKIRETVIEGLALERVGTYIGKNTYAIPVDTGDGTFYAKVTVTAAQRTDTKSCKAFNLEDAVAKYELAEQERAMKAEQRAAEKAAKLAKAGK